MAYEFKVNRVTISGTSFGGEEEWSTGFFLVNESSDVLSPTEQGAADIGAAWQTFFLAASTKMNSNWKTTQVKIATLNTTGGTDLSSVVYYNYPTPITGTTVTPTFPPQISLVATLLAGVPRGLGSKGRMYLPGIAVSPDGNGRIPTTDAANICNNLASFLNLINGDADVGDRVGNASFGRTPPAVGPGINRYVESVRVGNVYDTQRRRRNALTEQYSSATVVG